MRRAPLAAIVLLGAATLAGCRAPVKYYECRPPAEAASVDPLELWECNRDVMVRVSKRKKFTLKEFREAAAYFEGLTGIPADSRWSNLGRLPGPDVKKSLERWDEWFEMNRDGGGSNE